MLSDRAKGERKKLYRNRKVKYKPGTVLTDGQGNITDRPLTKRLECFADPVEWAWGQTDTPYVWRDPPPQPRNCALCPVIAFCGTVAWERIKTSPELFKLYNNWRTVTCRLPIADRFYHSSWAEFVTHCEKLTWTDANDRKLEESKEASKLTKRKKASDRSKPKPRGISTSLRQKIQNYRDQRVAELLAMHQNPKAPLWLRNRTAERAILIADVWQAREILENSNKKMSAKMVLKWLIENGRLDAHGPKAIHKRIGEVLNRVVVLVETGAWPFFDPDPPSVGANGRLHASAVTELLDD